MNCPNCGSTVVDSMKYCSKCGTPVAGPAYVPPVTPAAPQWMSNAAPPVKQKSGVGKILLIVGVVFVLLASAIGAAIYFGIRSYVRSTKSSAAYALAESMLRASPEVKERMGEIKNIGVPIGTSKEAEDGTGFAVFTMSIEGEKASGQYVVAMERRNSKWHVQEAAVKLQDGGEIRIAHASKTTSDEESSTSDSSVHENQNSDSTDINNANQKSKIISGGVLNGKATSLPKPDYPAAARAARVSGTVVVKVMVDEEGKVISATAVSGHPLLQASAVAAARQARFTPTLLSGKAVKVSGTINYNFVANP